MAWPCNFNEDIKIHNFNFFKNHDSSPQPENSSFKNFQTKTAIKLSISLKKYYSNIIVQTELVIFCNRKFQTRKTILKVFNYLACQYNADLIKDSQYLQLILTSPSGYCKSKIFQKSDIFLMGSKLNQKSSWNFKSLINTKRHQRKRRRRKV